MVLLLSGSEHDLKSSPEEKTKLKIGIVGANQVGKSALTVRYLTRRFIGEYTSNTDIIYHQSIPGNTYCELEIIDSSSGNISLSWDAIIIVYSVTEKSSYDFAQNALSTLSGTLQTLPPITLVANKCDLEHLRVVEKSDGVILASLYGANFVEVSVAENSSEVYSSISSLINSLVKPKRKFSMSNILFKIGKLSLTHKSSTDSVSSNSSTDTSPSSSETCNSPRKLNGKLWNFTQNSRK